VTINGDLSHLGPLSTGSVVIIALRCMNTLLCTSFQNGSSYMLPSLCSMWFWNSWVVEVHYTVGHTRVVPTVHSS
jgi:hypothetical protein